MDEHIERQTQYIERWIQTASGKKLSLDHPKPDSVLVYDIAHALSQLCRFGGHTVQFYSVAQHCVQVSIRVEQELGDWGLEALFHDVEEYAGYGDIVSPAKATLSPMYKNAVEPLRIKIFTILGLRYPYPDQIHDIDLRMCATEHRDLMVQTVESLEWVPKLGEPYPGAIIPQGPEASKALFLWRYHTLLNPRLPFPKPKPKETEDDSSNPETVSE